MTGTDLDEVNVPTDLDGKQVNIKDLSKFSVKRVLSINYKRKTICILGSFADRQGIAIIFLEKAPIKYESIKSLCSSGCKIEKDEVSADLLQCFPESELNKLKVTLIYPATEKHVKKYEFLPIHIIEETAELYNNTTLPCITSSSFNLQWVYNIFDHKAEQDSIIYEDLDADTGFLFLPDLKWNQNQVENLYVLAIARPRNIKSLRDLTGKHLPLLKNIRDKGKKIIKDKFGLDELQLRIYLHYQPSYFHLHVHFTNIDYKAPGINVTKAHLLNSVISNVELMSDYYQKTVLSFTVKESDNLFLCYKEKGLVKEVPPKDDIDVKEEEKKIQKDEVTE